MSFSWQDDDDESSFSDKKNESCGFWRVDAFCPKGQLQTSDQMTVFYPSIVREISLQNEKWVFNITDTFVAFVLVSEKKILNHRIKAVTMADTSCRCRHLHFHSISTLNEQHQRHDLLPIPHRVKGYAPAVEWVERSAASASATACNRSYKHFK